jgi:hypothetical protein
MNEQGFARRLCGVVACTRDVGLGVVRDALLKEVGLALQRNHVHEIEGVRRVVNLVIAESDEEAVSDKLDVLAHELGVHADKADRQSVCGRSQQ